MKISGTIVDSEGDALVGYRVVAYHGDVNLSKEKRLRGATTDEAEIQP